MTVDQTGQSWYNVGGDSVWSPGEWITGGGLLEAACHIRSVGKKWEAGILSPESDTNSVALAKSFLLIYKLGVWTKIKILVKNKSINIYTLLNIFSVHFHINDTTWWTMLSEKGLATGWLEASFPECGCLWDSNLIVSSSKPWESSGKSDYPELRYHQGPIIHKAFQSLNFSKPEKRLGSSWILGVV